MGPGMNMQNSGMIQQQQQQPASNITNDPMQIDTDDSSSNKAGSGGGPQVINYNHQNRSGGSGQRDNSEKTNKPIEDVTPQRPHGHGWPRERGERSSRESSRSDKGYRGYEKLTVNKTKAILSEIKLVDLVDPFLHCS